MSDDKHNKEIDELSGVETTGHEWDGLKELNNPLPRWWVWVFIICIVWSIWYFVIYPAWPVPGGATIGTGGYTQYKELAESQQIIKDRQEAYLSRFENASFDEILNDPELYAFAVAGGSAAFKSNCATCHGTGAQGGMGYPNLNDDDWLWGGKLEDIHQTLQYGIRADNDDTRYSQMPAFGQDELLERDEIDAVVDYVLSLSGSGDKGHHGEVVDAAHLAKGADVFQQQCASCHGENGQGDQDFGAPNLSDRIWLYGGDRETVFETVYYARAGMMPAWGERLGENTIRQLAVYLHQLGGGESEASATATVEEEEAAMPAPAPAVEEAPAPQEDAQSQDNPQQEGVTEESDADMVVDDGAGTSQE